MAKVRIFLPTYRRPKMLLRALEALRQQNFRDWICEVHNDDPADVEPQSLVQNLKDPRIELHNHKKNLGAIDSFNQFYRMVPEAYFSILEDDNLWEPEFLATMV